MNIMFKRWWSSILPISTKRTITSHQTWTHSTQKDHDIWHWKSKLGQAQKSGGVKAINDACLYYNPLFCIVLWRNILLLSLFLLSHFLEPFLLHHGSGCLVHVAVNKVINKIAQLVKTNCSQGNKYPSKIILTFYWIDIFINQCDKTKESMYGYSKLGVILYHIFYLSINT
jgi:hypothetical protein